MGFIGQGHFFVKIQLHSLINSEKETKAKICHFPLGLIPTDYLPVVSEGLNSFVLMKCYTIL